MSTKRIPPVVPQNMDKLPKFTLVPLPERLIAAATVTLPVKGESVTLRMSEFVDSLNRTWLDHLANK